MSGLSKLRVLFVTTCGTLAVCVGALTAQPPAAQDSDKLLGEVKAAWEQRQNAIRTLKASWKSKTHVPKGSLPPALGRDRPQVKGAPAEIPPTDVTHEGTGELATEGKKVRVVIQDSTWSGMEGKFTPCRRESVFDGKKFTRLLRPESLWPMATITNQTHNPDGAELTIWPLFLCVRSLDQDLTRSGFAFAQFEHARRVTLEGRAAIELTRPRNETIGEVRVLVDPVQAMAIRRGEVFDRAGNLSLRVAIVQQKVSEPEVGYLPQQWTVWSYKDKNKLNRQIEVTTTAVTLNPAIQEADFSVVFPPDTRVVDEINRTDYIARGDGTRRDIVSEERTAPYEELVRTSTGDLVPGGVGRGRNALYWIGGGVLIGVLSLLLIGKRWRGKSHSALSSATPPEKERI